MRGNITVLLLLVLLLGGCATQGQRVESLLAIEHTTLSNPELIHYFQRLNGELAREKRMARQQRGSDHARSEALWQRWNEVRRDMAQRDLLP
jgi:hypothetical protein